MMLLDPKVKAEEEELLTSDHIRAGSSTQSEINSIRPAQF